MRVKKSAINQVRKVLKNVLDEKNTTAKDNRVAKKYFGELVIRSL